LSLRDLLFPLAWVYRGITGCRNWLYDHRLLRVSHVETKVISIGNLTVGGTGKTPVTLALIEELRARGYSCGVVSRGYKRSKAGVLGVDNSPLAAHTFGDEPALIKASYPDVPVFVGKKRMAAVKALLAEKKVDFILCDDAFQHRSLHRDLNFLLLDVTESIRSYRLLPVGRSREALQPALKRADFIVLTKTNLIPVEELDEIREWIKSRAGGKPVLMAEYVFKGMRSLKGHVVQSFKDKAYLVSGIAKPQTLERTVGDRVAIVKHKAFPDHHRYTDLEIEALLDEASQLQARWILTTAKDGMKLGAFHRLRERLWIVDLGICFNGDVNAFYEAVDQLGRQVR
jgi:tetraacyldisaccharide 4'-kinase